MSFLDPKTAAHGPWDSFKWDPMPEFGGAKAIFHRSSDSKVVAGSFREKGQATIPLSFDQFVVVQEGTMKVSIHGGESFTLSKGHVAWLKKGQTVDVDMSEDFAEMAIFISDEKIDFI